MKVENFITGKLIPLESARKLVDSEDYVDRQTYLVSSNILRKGVLTKKELLEGKNIYDDFWSTVSKLRVMFKKYLNMTRRSHRKVMLELLALEQSRAISIFKKYRQALTKAEHTQIIQGILDESFFDYIKPSYDKVNITIHSIEEDLDIYFDNLAHMEEC